MGYVDATVELSNPRLPPLEAVETQALADSGALMLCIPAALAKQLQLTQESEREVSVADGRSIRVPYVGPVKVRCRGGSALWVRWCWATTCCWGQCPWKTWTSPSTRAGNA